MSPADGIRKLGFRRWYERQLIESHAYFVTCFLCMILVAALLEGLNFRGEATRTAAILGALFSGMLVGIVSLSRYRKVLDRAERIAEHSTCSSCNTYGRLEVVSEGTNASPADDDEPAWMRVRCRKCGHQWLIE